MATGDRTDLWFTSAGDYSVDRTGDIKDTSEIYGRSLIQEIEGRLRARKGDWKLNPMLGANIEDFFGESATGGTVNKIKSRILYELTSDGLVSPGDLEILSVSLGQGVVLFRLIIKTPKGELTKDVAYDSDTARFVGE